MYPTHFGLRQRPFPATPDPARYYPATSHERALARLLHGLGDGEGVVVLTARRAPARPCCVTACSNGSVRRRAPPS